VAGARHLLEAPLIVWSGDTLIDEPPLDELEARVRASGDLCLAVAPARGAGTVGLDAQGRIVRVRGEVHGQEVRAADYVSLFAAGARALAELPERGCLFTDYCMPRMRRGEPIDTCPVGGAWWDIGTPARYLQANLDWLQRRGDPSGSFVSASAVVDPAVAIGSSVVGAGARVMGSGALERCVVWPGSSVQAPLQGCVVTPHALVSTTPAAGAAHQP
jgi:mannose-1-phosphate guanylyltransferase